jgi:hypothetical protein
MGFFVELVRQNWFFPPFPSSFSNLRPKSSPRHQGLSGKLGNIEEDFAMPLRDHFRPPVSTGWPWDSVHATWTTSIAMLLNQRWLPSSYLALPQTHVGAHVEVDVATFHQENVRSRTGNGIGTAVWASPRARSWKR